MGRTQDTKTSVLEPAPITPYLWDSGFIPRLLRLLLCASVRGGEVRHGGEPGLGSQNSEAQIPPR